MSEDRLNQLIEAANELPLGRHRADMMEMAIAEADALGDAGLSYQLRMDFIQSAFFCGLGDRATVAFAWCLKYADDHPEEFSPDDHLWKYKWVLNVLPRLPQISKAKILEMVDDMGRRVKEAGYSPRPVHYMRWKVLTDMGDFDGAAAEIEKWRPAVKDYLKDCPACEADSEVDYLAHSGQNEKAIEMAKRIIDGKMTCAEVPHVTFGWMIRPLLRLGRIEEAIEYSERGYRMVRKNEEFIPAVSEHLLVATHANKGTRAQGIFTRHAIWSLETGMPFRRFVFAAAASAFLEKLGRGGFSATKDSDDSEGKPKKSRSSKRLQLPHDHPLHNVDDRYDPLELAAWYRQDAEDLARQFDQRNGNDFISCWLSETRQLAG